MFRSTRVASARRLAAGLAAVAVAVGVAGCTHSTSSPPTPPASTPGSGPTSTAGSSPTPSPSPVRTGSGDATLGFAGDVHFENQVKRLLDDPASALAPIKADLSKPDVMMLNLESAIVTSGTPRPKRFQFGAPPTAFDALRAAGIDLVTMANNHAVDYGWPGLTQTLSAIKDKNFPVVGIGDTLAAAYAPHIVDVNGVRVAFFGADQIQDATTVTFHATPNGPGVAWVNGPNGVANLVDAIKAVRPDVDVVVAFIHWGSNYTSCPNADQKSLAATLAGAGADVIVGAHSHVLQGAGWLGNTYVEYGLGNFVWWQRIAQSGEPEHATGILTVQVKDRKVTGATWAPADVQSSGLPKFLQGAAADQATRAWQNLRGCAGLAASPSG